MGQTFKAICPETKDLQVFEIVSEKGKTVGWCTKCRNTWPLAELTDGQKDDGPGKPRKAKKRSKHK